MRKHLDDNPDIKKHESCCIAGTCWIDFERLLNPETMRLKIVGGTVPAGEESLCNTCRKATIIQGSAIRERIIECNDLTMRNQEKLRFPVKTCTAYTDRRTPTIRDFEDIAWVLRSDNKKQIGFVPAKDLKPAERHTLSDFD